MVTNYYCGRKLQSDAITELKRLASEEKFDELHSILENNYKPYYIGKRTSDGLFIFQLDSVLWGDNLDKLREYLSLPTVEILDAYGKHYTYEEFWENEVGELQAM